MFILRVPLSNCFLFYVKATSVRLKMPKYAVAVGRKVGIYDTYAECQEQVLNYPGAKYKKFNTVKDAEAFIKEKTNQTFNKPRDCTVNNHFNPLGQTRSENINPPELFKIEKMSPKSDLFALTNRVSCLEEKLSKFICDTSNTLESLVNRVNNLEGKASCSSDYKSIEPPLKKLKTDIEPIVGELITNPDGFVVVYTDGACSNNGRTGAQAGIGVWFNENHPLNISAPVQGPATNNNAEIQAARVAITQAHHAGIKKLAVNTDSKFVINCITEWINKWKKNDWTLSSGGLVKNKAELIKLDNAIQLLEAVEWNYVAGHCGIRGNEMADKLAREGARSYKSNITYSRNAELSSVKFFNVGNKPE